ncbi:hypothetical protein N825_36350 [Skermanella stibiiresistens SB22]|uniref:Glycosyltransferase subfamily 4-like N-terminal domain-containing protein n=2 Tax=Skermanella TaxID=204447 RepID=W9H995_9PROT|nr:hypothetical protein N825_36350 [Skermanella stibiiresistens SB22]
MLLTPTVPHPASTGASMRAWRILRHLSGTYRVHLGCFADDSIDRRREGFVRQFCHGAFFARCDAPVTRGKGAAGLLGLGRPSRLGQDAGLSAWVERIWNERRPTRVLALCAAMAPYALMRPDFPARRVLDRADIDGDQELAPAIDLKRPSLAIWRWLQIRELRAMLLLDQHRLAPWDASLLNSARAVATLREMFPEIAGRIHHVPDGIDTVRFAPNDGQHAAPLPYGGRSILMAGPLDSQADADAAKWFAREVLPRVRAVAPDCRLILTSGEPTPAMRYPATCPGVTLATGVRDIRPWIAHASVVVAPQGTPKSRLVLEAMAMARPVVAAPAALGDARERVERDLWLAEGATDFGHAVLAALHPTLGPSVGRAARARILATHSWEAGLTRLDAVLEGRAFAIPARTHTMSRG